MRKKHTHGFPCETCKKVGVKSLSEMKKVSCVDIMSATETICSYHEYLIDDSQDYIKKTKRVRW